MQVLTLFGQYPSFGQPGAVSEAAHLSWSGIDKSNKRGGKDSKGRLELHDW